KIRQPSDFCILFRTNALSRSLEVALRNRNIPYQLVRGLEFFKRREVRDVVAWLRLLKNPRDDEAFLRIVNVPPRGIGKQSLDRLAAWAEQQHMSRLDAAGYAAQVPALTRRAIQAYEKFRLLFQAIQQVQQQSNGAVAPLVEAILEKTGYRDLLATEKDEEGDERLANVEELVTAARQVDESFEVTLPDDDPLSQFLEQTALVADTDIWDPAGNQVALMTFHACKGLEFPVVYMIALEDGILPHERSLDDNDQLEEERRLVFVGITRGQQEVHVSASRIRDYRGNRRISAPSVFLTEMLGEESYLSGPEAPALSETPSCEHNQDEEFSTKSFANYFSREEEGTVEDQLDDSNYLDTTHQQTRSDGLVLEIESDFIQEVDFDRKHVKKTAQQKTPNPHQSPSILTANKLHQGTPKEVSFDIGDRVFHEEYGEGVLEKIGGTGHRTIGVVRFDGANRTRSFVLKHGALKKI
ncbi:MAG: 3'-5' exonuclease, partial [Pirellulales bacterium]